MPNQLEENIKNILKGMGYAGAYDPKGDLESFYKLQPKGEERAQDKKALVYDLTPKDGSDSIRIVPLFDVHAGLNTTDLRKFESYVEYIHNQPNTYTVLGGDLHESATMTSVGKAVLDEVMHTKDQRRYMERTLKPLADAKKILVGIPGNHEERVAKFNGDNPMEELCHDLGVPYPGYQAFLRIKAGKQKYDVMVFHGAGGGRTKGSKANSATRPNEVAVMDLYLTGHTHDKTYLEDMVYYIDENDQLVSKKRVYVVCGSFLRYFGGYPEMKGLPPAIMGGVRIDLLTERKAIHVHY